MRILKEIMTISSLMIMTISVLMISTHNVADAIYCVTLAIWLKQWGA